VRGAAAIAARIAETTAAIAATTGGTAADDIGHTHNGYLRVARKTDRN